MSMATSEHPVVDPPTAGDGAAASDDIGVALTAEQETNLHTEYDASCSRSLAPAERLAFNTGMRYSEIRLLCW
jgi:hypothetical protein